MNFDQGLICSKSKELFVYLFCIMCVFLCYFSVGGNLDVQNVWDEIVNHYGHDWY